MKYFHTFITDHIVHHHKALVYLKVEISLGQTQNRGATRILLRKGGRAWKWKIFVTSFWWHILS